jgi:MoxR-like ATPase
MLYSRQRENPLDAVEPVASTADLAGLQGEVREVEVKEPVARYLLRIVAATREAREVELGVSPRGALALFRAAQARAFLLGRRYVSPEDVQSLAGPVLAHRLVLTTQARYGGVTGEAVVARIAGEIGVPT